LKTVVLALSLAVASIAADHKRVVPADSAVYVDSNNGFELFILAAFQEKHVPLKLVSSPDKADYILDSSLFHSASAVASGNSAAAGQTTEGAFKLTSKSGDIVWAYAVTKGLLHRGKQSAAEACAKHLNEIIDKKALSKKGNP
jgi:hypothetical protein